MDEIINSLINYIIENKKLQFTINEISLDEILFNKDVLKRDSNKITIQDFQLIASKFIHKYKKKFDFEPDDNFQNTVDFITSVKSDFTSDIYVQDFLILEKEIWKSLIKESNFKFKNSLNIYLKSIDPNNKPSEIYRFIEGYSAALFELDIDSEEIIENSIILIKLTKSNATYSIPLSNILKGIRKKCMFDYELGIKLLNESLELDKDYDDIFSAIISGLYQKKGIEFYNSHLKKIIEEDNKINSIFLGLSNVSKLTNSDCELFLKLISNHESDDHLISSLLVVFSILKSENDSHHIFCFKFLESAIENENAVFYILGNLSNIDKYDENKTAVLIKLIGQSFFKIEKHIELISRIFWTLKDFNSLKKIILKIIEKKPFEKFIHAFRTNSFSPPTIDLDNLMIELLTDNSASKRFTGIEIFDELSSFQQYRFMIDITKLPPLVQYKLIVRLTQGYFEPKKRLITLLPLIDSTNEFIKDAIICKLEELSEDYGGYILEILNEGLNKGNSNHLIILRRIENYIEKFYSVNVDFKNSISELNAYNTYFGLINRFNELFHKKINQTMEENANKDSWYSLLGANTIHLAKGGGWRIGEKKEIHSLGKAGTSFVLPRSYFINPNRFEIAVELSVYQDWNDEDFIEIDEILRDE